MPSPIPPPDSQNSWVSTQPMSPISPFPQIEEESLASFDSKNSNLDHLVPRQTQSLPPSGVAVNASLVPNNSDESITFKVRRLSAFVGPTAWEVPNLKSLPSSETQAPAPKECSSSKS